MSFCVTSAEFHFTSDLKYQSIPLVTLYSCLSILVKYNLKLNIFFRNLTLTLFQLMVVIENLRFQVPMMFQMSRPRFTIISAKTKLRLSKIHLPPIHTTCRQISVLIKKCCLWILKFQFPKLRKNCPLKIYAKYGIPNKCID